MNKHQRYLYVVSPGFGLGSACYMAYELDSSDPAAGPQSEAALAAARSAPRSDPTRRTFGSMLRLPSALRRASRRYLQRRPSRAGAAA